MADFDATPFKGKMPWPKRAKLIKEQFPRTAQLDWKQVFSEDPHVMGRILGDIFKADMAEPGRPGKRPAVDPKIAAEKYRRFSGDDYSTLPFAQALAALKGTKSVRHFARNTGLTKSTLDRILRGEKEADLEMIIDVAKNLGKHPSYFVEYRVGYVTAVVSHYLEWAPEASVVQYNKIKGNYENASS